MSEMSTNNPSLEFDLYDRLRKSMRVADKTSTDLARDLGVHRNTIANVLGGRVRVERRTLVAWAVATGVPVAWLEHGVEPNDGPDGGLALPIGSP